jgi:hypothetical protein
VEPGERWAVDLRNDFEDEDDDEYEDDFDYEDEPPWIERYGTIRSSGFRLLCAGHQGEMLKTLFITIVTIDISCDRYQYSLRDAFSRVSKHPDESL